jgi:hypothetical protein
MVLGMFPYGGLSVFISFNLSSLFVIYIRERERFVGLNYRVSSEDLYSVVSFRTIFDSR